MFFIKPQTVIEQAVLGILSQHGFENLSESDQQAFFPQFVAEAERRLGLAVLPLLDEEAAKEFEKKLHEEESADQWYAFWSKYVPNFNELIDDTLEKFGSEVAAVMPK